MLSRERAVCIVTLLLCFYSVAWCPVSYVTVDVVHRKLVSAACILLAAKISSDLKKQEVKHLIDVCNTNTHTHTVSVKKSALWVRSCSSCSASEAFLPEQVENDLLSVRAAGLEAVNVLYSRVLRPCRRESLRSDWVLHYHCTVFMLHIHFCHGSKILILIVSVLRPPKQKPCTSPPSRRSLHISLVFMELWIFLVLPHLSYLMKHWLQIQSCEKLFVLFLISFISFFIYAHLLHFIFQKIKKKAKITWVTKLVITFLYIPGPVWKSNSPLVKLLNVIRDSFCKAEFSYTKRTRALLLLYMFNQEITKIEVIWQSETNEKIS